MVPFDAYRIFVNVPYYLETDTDFRKPNDQPVLPLIIADLEKYHAASRR